MSMCGFSAPSSSLSSLTLTQTIQCSALAAVPQLKGKIYVPGSNAYDARLKTYYSANAALEPWCMVLPETTQDVSKIAKVISKKKCPFGIRSGAHSAWKGSNGVENGITIDFSMDVYALLPWVMANCWEAT
ncbi:hypothetical protein NW767_007976 [Fusarium falciforme]|nr:hypothetical protein NW767_007976 [Fusarium falciforme]